MPKILPEILAAHQEKIQKLIEKESEGPKQHVKVSMARQLGVLATFWHVGPVQLILDSAIA